MAVANGFVAPLAFGLFAVETNTWGTALDQLRSELNLPLWGAVASSVLLIWWGVTVYLRHRSTVVRKIDNPQRLFHDVCKAQRLSWKEMALLEQLAEARGLDDPVVLFVRDDYFDVENLVGEINRLGEQVAKLRDKLFAITTTDALPPEPEAFAETKDVVEPTGAA